MIKYFYGCGKRKTAIAKVRLLPEGSGKFTINNKFDLAKFSQTPVLSEKILVPFKVTDTKNSFDVLVHVAGGGFHAQTEAIRHGIARALIKYNAEFRPLLRRANLITRDSRIKERKKYGLKRARRAPQFSKR